MAMNTGLSIKRLTKEFSDMQKKPSYMYYAEPVKGEMFEWHFTIRGPPGTDYEGGLYHGIILFPEKYPFKPPSVQFLTPNGRFETNTKICLTFTNFHPEYWQPAWTVRTILLGLISYMPVEEETLSIGSIMCTPAERKRLAKASQFWKCQTCKSIKELIADKMTEENKVNDDATPKEELPEFKLTKKVSRKPQEDSKVSDGEETPDENDPLIQEEEKEETRLGVEKELEEIERNQKHLEEEKNQIFNNPAEIQLDEEKREYRDFIELQRQNATKKASRCFGFLFVLWIIIGISSTYYPELLKEIFELIL